MICKKIKVKSSCLYVTLFSAFFHSYDIFEGIDTAVAYSKGTGKEPDRIRTQATLQRLSQRQPLSYAANFGCHVAQIKRIKIGSFFVLFYISMHLAEFGRIYVYYNEL